MLGGGHRLSPEALEKQYGARFRRPGLHPSAANGIRIRKLAENGKFPPCKKKFKIAKFGANWVILPSRVIRNAPLAARKNE